MKNQSILTNIKNILAITSLGLLSIVLIILILGAFGFNPFKEPSIQKVTVTGNSEEFIIPSSVMISVEIAANSSDRNEAINKITAAESKVLKQLSSLGIQANDIVKIPFTTTQSNDKYYANSSIKFVLRDLKNFSQIDSVRSIPNVSSADYNQYQLSESPIIDNTLKEKLIALATSDARKQVENSASLLGGKVGKVTEFNNVVKIEPYRTPSIEKIPSLDPISIKFGYYISAQSTISYNVEFK